MLHGTGIELFNKFIHFELHMNYLKYEFFILVFFQRPTALAKIVGAFRIGFRNNQTNNDLKQDLLVMENLFYNCSISQVRFVIVLNSLAWGYGW